MAVAAARSGAAPVRQRGFRGAARGRSWSHPDARASHRPARRTDFEVLRLLVLGETVRSIGKKLGVSQK